MFALDIVYFFDMVIKVTPLLFHLLLASLLFGRKDIIKQPAVKFLYYLPEMHLKTDMYPSFCVALCIIYGETCLLQRLLLIT